MSQCATAATGLANETFCLAFDFPSWAISTSNCRTGHFARECPEGDGGGNVGGSVCYRCDRSVLAVLHYIITLRLTFELHDY